MFQFKSKQLVILSVWLNKVFTKIQTLIDKLDLSHLMDLVEKIGTTYETENEQIMSLMDSMKDIFQSETEEK